MEFNLNRPSQTIHYNPFKFIVSSIVIIAGGLGIYFLSDLSITNNITADEVIIENIVGEEVTSKQETPQLKTAETLEKIKEELPVKETSKQNILFSDQFKEKANLVTKEPLLNEVSSDSMSCILIGKIINRDSKTIKILRLMDDSRFHIKDEIKIENNTFYYDLKFIEIEAFKLIFTDELQKGAWRPIVFFPEINDTIYMDLNPTEDFEKNKFKGKKHVEEFKKLHQIFNPPAPEEIKILSDESNYLWDEKLYFTQEYYDLLAQLKGSTADDKRKIYEQKALLERNDNHLSEKSKLIQKKLKVFSNELKIRSLSIIRDAPSLVAYSFLMNEFNDSHFEMSLFNDYKKTFQVFAKYYPEHRYTDLIKKILASREKLKIGSPSIDFAAYNLESKKEEKLSSHLVYDILYLDLWASWCGPCIAHSRAMIPVYERYKNKGFSVLGVAREFKTTKNFEVAIEREKFPWKNLIELDDKNEIWLSYNIPFAGGGRYLIDRDGTVLAINPSIDELKAILNEKL